MSKRELKFRIWSKNKKTFLPEWYPNKQDLPAAPLIGINGRLWDWSSQHWGFDNELVEKPEEFVIQQFTGLKDKTGKEIYEGDILKSDYEATYEILDANGEFVEWSKYEKAFSRFYEVTFYCGDYEINCGEYTIGLNGWAAKLIKDTRKSTYSDVGKVQSLCQIIKNHNYGAFGLTTQYISVVGNTFENPELLNE